MIKLRLSLLIGTLAIGARPTFAICDLLVAGVEKLTLQTPAGTQTISLPLTTTLAQRNQQIALKRFDDIVAEDDVLVEKYAAKMKYSRELAAHIRKLSAEGQHLTDDFFRQTIAARLARWQSQLTLLSTTLPGLLPAEEVVAVARVKLADPSPLTQARESLHGIIPLTAQARELCNEMYGHFEMKNVATQARILQSYYTRLEKIHGQIPEPEWGSLRDLYTQLFRVVIDRLQNPTIDQPVKRSELDQLKSKLYENFDPIFLPH